MLSSSTAWLLVSACAYGKVTPDANTTNTPSKKCPTEMALVTTESGTSCVDKWEASVVSVHAKAAHSPYEPVVGEDVKAVSQPGVVPQAHVSLLDAKRACSNAGKRLCRADEWVAACKGPEKTLYPYGEVRSPGTCIDTGRTAPLTRLYGKDDMFTSKAMNDPRLNQMDNTVAKTGEAAQCTNAYGVHDMVGNVHEWVDDGTFRGGYYLDTKDNREGCDYTTSAHSPEYYDYSTGFRCCADPSPGPATSSTLSSAPADDALPHAPTRPRQGVVDHGFFTQIAQIAVGAAPVSDARVASLLEDVELRADRRSYLFIAQ